MIIYHTHFLYFLWLRLDDHSLDFLLTWWTVPPLDFLWLRLWCAPLMDLIFLRLLGGRGGASKHSRVKYWFIDKYSSLTGFWSYMRTFELVQNVHPTMPSNHQLRLYTYILSWYSIPSTEGVRSSNDYKHIIWGNLERTALAVDACPWAVGRDGQLWFHNGYFN